MTIGNVLYYIMFIAHLSVYLMLQIMLIDENEARLRVRTPLNCEKRRNYKFDIAAVGCDGTNSNM